MRAPRALLAIAATMLAAGCGGKDSPTALQTDYLGTYDLESVEGQQLPAVLLDDGGSYLAITAGQVSLGPSNVATMSVTFDLRQPGVPEQNEVLYCGGSQHRSGNHVTITLSQGFGCTSGSYDAVLDGTTLTVDDPRTGRMIYRRHQ